MQSPIFAHVSLDQHVLQYPMNYDDINARNNPTDIYYPCVYSDMDDPLTPSLAQKIIEKARIIGNTVYVERTIGYKTVDELFSELRALTGVVSGPIPNNAVSPAVFSAFEKVIKVKITEDLNTFAATRGYDDIKSLCSYVNSAIPTYQAEAARGILIQDATWSALFNYFQAIQAGTQPIPLSWSEMASILPAFTWEDS